MKRIAALLAVGPILLAAVSAATAQQQPGTVSVSASLTGIQQFRSSLRQGGDVRWNSLALAASVTRQFVPAFSAGLAVRYEAQDWRFGGSTILGGAAPWSRLRHTSVGLTLGQALSRTMLVGVSPTLEWAGEEDTGSNDAVMYGAVVSLVKVFSPRFTLGGGANLTRQFYSVKTSPFVIVNWRLTERLRIANAIPSGPEGGAGVELRYAPGPEWELGGGGVYRSDRWRLDGRGRFPREVAETSCIPLLARCSRRLDAASRLDLYAGVLLAGRLRVKDRDGNTLATQDVSPAPAFALGISRRL